MTICRCNYKILNIFFLKKKLNNTIPNNYYYCNLSAKLFKNDNYLKKCL